MIKRVTSILLLLFLLLCIACEKAEDPPEIAWQTGSSLNYSYSGGVLSGFTANLKFAVINDLSGEVKFTATFSGDKEKCSGFVEPGEIYTVSIRCTINSSGEKGSIVVDSPSATDPYKVVSEYKVKLGSISL